MSDALFNQKTICWPDKLLEPIPVHVAVVKETLLSISSDGATEKTSFIVRDQFYL